MRIRWFSWSGAFAILVFAAELHAASSFSQRPCASPVLAKAGARCGVVEVAENPSKPDRKISLNVIIVPALHPKPGAPPVFHLEGGPGISATQAAGFYAGPGSMYRESRDVVLFDQRGTGGSNPLHCAAIENRSPLEEEFVAADVTACRKELSAKADLRNYSTARAAEDIDAVREALHAAQIDIWSISYGTRLAQEYIKRFPTQVRRAVLAGFAPLDYKTPLFHAMNAQRVVDLLLFKCRADESCSSKYPKLNSEWNAVLERLDHSPARVSWNGKPALIARGPFTEAVRQSLTVAAGQRQFPAMVHAAFSGDFGPFLALVRKGPSPFAMGLYLTIACSEGGSRIAPGDVERYTAGTFLGDYRLRQELGECSEWPPYEVSPDFFAPPARTPPLLVMSGEMDQVAPPDYAEQFCSKLQDCHLVTIPDLGHGPFDLDAWRGGDCYDQITTKFLEQGIIEDSCLKQMHPPAFR